MLSDSLRPPWTAACQASLSITNSWSLPRLMSIESVMPSNHLILCHPLLLLPSVFPSIRVFSNGLALRIRWPKYWSFSISPSGDYSALDFFKTDWFDSFLSKGFSSVFSSTTVQKHQFFGAQPSLWSNSHIPFIHDYYKNHSFDFRRALNFCHVPSINCSRFSLVLLPKLALSKFLLNATE